MFQVKKVRRERGRKGRGGGKGESRKQKAEKRKEKREKRKEKREKKRKKRDLDGIQFKDMPPWERTGILREITNHRIAFQSEISLVQPVSSYPPSPQHHCGNEGGKGELGGDVLKEEVEEKRGNKEKEEDNEGGDLVDSVVVGVGGMEEEGKVGDEEGEVCEVKRGEVVGGNCGCGEGRSDGGGEEGEGEEEGTKEAVSHHG